MQTWFSARDLVGLPGMPASLRGVQSRAGKGQWQSRKRAGRGGGLEYHIDSLPAATQAALAAATDGGEPPSCAAGDRDAAPDARRRDAEAAWRAWEQRPPGDRDRAQQRLQILRAYEHLRSLGHTKQQIERAIKETYDVSGPTLRRWWKAVAGAHRSDWLALLATQYQGRQSTAECSEAAWRHFLSIYLKLEAPSLAICHDQVARIAADHAWSWPSEKAIRRRVEREIPWQVITREREGVDALRQKLPMQERDRSVLHAMEALNTDGHVFDWWIRWPDGEVRRPTVLAWQDLYSNMVLSWRVDKTENSDGIRLSFADAIASYGVPDAVHSDNGFGYASKVMSGGTPTRYRFRVRDDDPIGVYESLNIRVHWTIPYRGSSKPIERMWRELEDRLRARPELNGAWAGNAPGVKPNEYKPEPVELDTFLDVVDAEIDAYNRRGGRQGADARGRSYAETFEQSYATAVVARPTAEQLRFCMLASEGVRCAKKDASIRLVTGGNRYWHEALAPYAGEKLSVRFDPQRLHDEVHVYTLEGRYVCAAECVQRIGWNDSEAAREQRRLESQHRKAATKAADLLERLSAREASANILPREPAPDETPQPAAARLVRPTTTRGNAALDAEEQERESAAQAAFEEDFQGVSSLLEERLKRKGRTQL